MLQVYEYVYYMEEPRFLLSYVYILRYILIEFFQVLLHGIILITYIITHALEINFFFCCVFKFLILFFYSSLIPLILFSAKNSYC